MTNNKCTSTSFARLESFNCLKKRMGKTIRNNAGHERGSVGGLRGSTIYQEKRTEMGKLCPLV